MKQAMFLYGTLRAGEALSDLLPDGLDRYSATVPGRLHYAPHTYGHPVLLPAETADDRVHGEVVWLNLEDRDPAYVVLMEIQAGYSATWARVNLNVGGHIEALTFTWHPHDGAGPRVPEDDWTLRNVDAKTCSGCNAIWPTTYEAAECEWSHTVAESEAT